MFANVCVRNSKGITISKFIEFSRLNRISYEKNVVVVDEHHPFRGKVPNLN